MMVRAAMANRTSKDANSFAPCFFSAHKNENSAFLADIALVAVSVFLCLLSKVFSIIALLLIVNLSLCLLSGKQMLTKFSWV